MRVLMIAPEPFFTPRGTPFSIRGRIKALSALGHPSIWSPIIREMIYPCRASDLSDAMDSMGP